ARLTETLVTVDALGGPGVTHHCSSSRGLTVAQPWVFQFQSVTWILTPSLMNWWLGELVNRFTKSPTRQLTNFCDILSSGFTDECSHDRNPRPPRVAVRHDP